MKSRLRAFVFSFQTKLVLALTAVVLLAMLLAGVVFVYRTRADRQQSALDRVAAASPAIYQQAFLALLPDEQKEGVTYSQLLDSLSAQQQVRILVVSNDGAVLYDTSGHLAGTAIDVPRSSLDDLRRGFVAWRPAEGFAEHGLTLVSASGRFTAGGRQLPFRIVLVVPTATISGAWRGVLPGLTVAAAIAVVIAMLAGTLLARQVAQPVRRLTQASEALAAGDFSQRVELHRNDEMGRLARAFTSMVQRVGQRDSQMRALLANVSHDLKTPMTSITGYAQALTDGTADPADAAHIGSVIKDEAEHVNGLLADLLYLGEIDAGQVITRQEDVPLDAIVERCVRRIETQAKAKDIDITLDVEDEPVLSGVDPDKVERALTNILDNAAKFTPEHGRIAVHGWRENGATPSRAVCAVTNSGSAIAEEDLPRVFDRFFRSDRARQTEAGNGLGLSITRELVELNRGHIAAASGAEGVTFTVTLPAR